MLFVFFVSVGIGNSDLFEASRMSSHQNMSFSHACHHSMTYHHGMTCYHGMTCHRGVICRHGMTCHRGMTCHHSMTATGGIGNLDLSRGIGNLHPFHDRSRREASNFGLDRVFQGFF